LGRRLPQRATRHMLGSRRNTDRGARQIAKFFEEVASAEPQLGQRGDLGADLLVRSSYMIRPSLK